MIVFAAPTGHCCRVSATPSRTGSYLNVYRLSTKYHSSLWPYRAPPLDLGTPSTLSLMLLGSQDGSSKGEFMTVFGALAGDFGQVSASPSRIRLLLNIFDFLNPCGMRKRQPKTSIYGCAEGAPIYARYFKKRSYLGTGGERPNFGGRKIF